MQKRPASPQLFTRKPVIIVELAGLLARIFFEHLPAEWFQQWLSLMVHSKINAPAYSYGDSAGLTPDFPFNPLMIFLYRLHRGDDRSLLPMYLNGSSAELRGSKPHLRQPGRTPVAIGILLNL